jgi:hypothetical protein
LIAPQRENVFACERLLASTILLSILCGVRLADLSRELVTPNSARLSTPIERQPRTESRRHDVIFDAEVTMRKSTLAFGIMVLIAACVGAWAMLRHVAAGSNAVAASPAGSPSTANMSPIEIMKERGKDLPAAKNADPF